MKKGKVLPIAEIGNRVLRKKTKTVSFPLDDTVLQLIADMFQTMMITNGVGIAAPQVFQSLRIIIIASRPNERYPYAPLMKPVVMINPEIIEKVDRLVTDWEGCLSVPNIRGLVPCSESVTIRYQDVKGKSTTKKLTGFPARIVQHEVAHIQGLLFTDRVRSSLDLYSQSEFKKRLKRRPKTKIQKAE
jgi:peptide deformylase